MKGSRIDPFDLLVVGGGINGAGIARDAALRGLSVCLLEAKDWCSGTSSKSSMLAHGGLRYLEQFELGLVHEALQDRELMLRQAPHLVRPLRFIYPLYPHIASRRTVRVGLWLYDQLSHGKSVPKRGRLSREAVLAELPHLEPDQLAGAATYWDAQFRSVERFVWELVQDARHHGADCRNHASVERLVVEDGRCIGARVDGETVHARATINAAGPWVDPLLDASLPGQHHLIRKTKGTHLFVPRFLDAALIVRAKDGRTFFFIPCGTYTAIGTTDTDEAGEPRDVAATRADVDYLLAAARQYFPDAPLDVQFTYAGVRPLVHEAGLTEGNVTRKHVLHDHAKAGIDGLWSVQGGKLTTYRHLSEEAVTTVCKVLGKRKMAKLRPTRAGTLPGGPLVAWSEFRSRAIEAATAAGALPTTAEHLVDTYGAGWRVVAEGTPERLQRIHKSRPHCWAEIEHAVEQEMACHLGDVMLRRTDLGFAPDGARHIARSVARHMQKLLDWSDEQAAAQWMEYEAEVARFAVPAAEA